MNKEKIFDNNFFAVIWVLSFFVPLFMIIKAYFSEDNIFPGIIFIATIVILYLLHTWNFYIYFMVVMILWIWGLTALIIHIPHKVSETRLIIAISLYSLFFIYNITFNLYYKIKEKIGIIRKKVSEFEDLNFYPPYKYLFRCDIYENNNIILDIGYFNIEAQKELECAIPENYVSDISSNTMILNLENANKSDRYQINTVIKKIYDEEFERRLEKSEAIRKEIYGLYKIPVYYS